MMRICSTEVLHDFDSARGRSAWWARRARINSNAAKALPSVRVIATGGTIAGAQASATDYGYKSGAYDVNTLIRAVPNLGKLARITGEQVANIGSQDMNDDVWLKLARSVDAALAQPDVDAVLITHGTDTLEETATSSAWW